MPWYGVVALVTAGGWLIKQVGDTADAGSKLGAVLLVAGGGYVAAKALKVI